MRNPAVALTFDDGPSPSTPRLLELLQQLAIPATFFQVGVNVRRLPDITRTISDLGHELANHTDTHARLWLQSPSAVRLEIELAQSTILQAAGKAPKWFRAPYGVRWFGVAAAQRDLKLTGAMWTVIGLDWKLAAPAVADRLIHGAGNGAIFCLHDGRERL
ncbi:MAG TPA: polysaccharide deacetylase family protein, partial [Bryobacteraceae bacterium]|nr:polysaccharide deacetylase family protein [Bryobacteraceae bacterium]